ncbi:hypothetical protein R8Z50_14080 [Longispora sp. K20-0274]|uniref:hypothetical protein n=1 Tax=Longispora sp. K20-0274 TaxID=3088255 RepID=UPI00399AE870
MLKAQPRQIKDLAEKISSFTDAFGPGALDAILFVDDEGNIGFSAGPDAPAGCRVIMNRAGIDRLMVLHAYTTLDLERPDTKEAFAELVFENAWLS